MDLDKEDDQDAQIVDEEDNGWNDDPAVSVLGGAEVAGSEQVFEWSHVARELQDSHE